MGACCLLQPNLLSDLPRWPINYNTSMLRSKQPLVALENGVFLLNVQPHQGNTAPHVQTPIFVIFKSKDQFDAFRKHGVKAMGWYDIFASHCCGLHRNVATIGVDSSSQKLCRVEVKPLALLAQAVA